MNNELNKLNIWLSENKLGESLRLPTPSRILVTISDIKNYIYMNC